MIDAPAAPAVQPPADEPGLLARIDALLPQTQCGLCGYPGCRPYAAALASGCAAINQCPPGGDDGARELAALLGVPGKPVDARFGAIKPQAVALIDESLCIGCTLCIKACPVDCIVGAPKRMHTVIAESCTGCELCVPVCPVDCIAMLAVPSPATGWAAWGSEQAAQARTSYAWHQERTRRDMIENDERLAAKAQAKLDDLQAASAITDPLVLDSKRAIVEAALARAQRQREQP